MTANPTGPRSRARADSARSAGPHGRQHGGRHDQPGRLVTAAQILLGLTLSCLFAVLAAVALGVVVGLVVYLTR
ncbi:MAG: hypothetical protein ACRDVE_13870 [Actinocrinis sp.]